MMEIKKITQSKYFVAVLGALGCLIAGAVIFAAGVHVGERRARYSYQWGANYEKNFVGSGRGPVNEKRGPQGMMRGFEGRDFRNGHGVSGIIISVSDASIIIKDRDGKENTIAVNEKTLIKNGQADIKISDLKNDQSIVAIGNPGDNGVVNADLIRVFENNINTNTQQQ
jgi:hypothetical protein